MIMTITGLIFFLIAGFHIIRSNLVVVLAAIGLTFLAYLLSLFFQSNTLDQIVYGAFIGLSPFILMISISLLCWGAEELHKKFSGEKIIKSDMD